MNIAMVGCGQIADAHIQEARRIAGVSVVSVCDSNIHMAHQAAVRFGIPSHYTDLERMLEEVRPDVVHITTPPASHLRIGLSAIRQGCHLYVEKPFVINAGEAAELIGAAEKAGRLVCVGHNLAYDESFLRLRELYEAGELGDVIHVDTYMGYDLAGGFGNVLMRDPGHWVHKLPGGLVQNGISHPLSLLLEFVRDQTPTVLARSYHWRKVRYGDIRDRFSDELRVSVDGRQTTGSVVFSSHTRPVQIYAVVHGTKCQAVASLDSRTMWTFSGATHPGPFFKLQWARTYAKAVRQEYRRTLRHLIQGKLHYFQGLHTLISRFYMAIRGEGPLPIPMSEAYRITAVMDEVFRQCCEGDVSVDMERMKA